MFSDNNNDNTVQESEIIQQSHFYPFGMEMEGDWSTSTPNKYLYNGKEINKEFDLDWYDYGARFYDPSVGRFMSVDPLADQRSWVSPYNYVQNNPLNRVDPTGMLDNPIYGEDGSFLGTDDKGMLSLIHI